MLREVGEGLFKGCSMLDVPGNTKNTPLFMDKLFGNVAGLKGTGKSTHRNFIFIFAGESQKLQKKRERERKSGRKRVCVVFVVESGWTCAAKLNMIFIGQG